MAEERTHLAARPGGRFDPNVIASRIEKLRILAGVEPKEIGGHIWPNQKPENAARSWYRRASSRLQDFDLGEIEKAVDYLAERAHARGKTPARYLPGFPFIELHESERIERG